MSTFLRGVALAASLSSQRAAERVELGVARVDEHVGVGHLAELEQLGVGERRLGRAAPAEHDDLPDARSRRAPRARGRPRRCAASSSRVSASMRATSAATLPLPITIARSQREVELEVAVVGMAVVPGDELGGGPAAGQVLAGDAHAPVGLGADRVDHRVVAGEQVLVGDVGAVLDVAEEAELGVGRGLLVDAADRLDVGVVGRDAAAHEAPRGGQPVVDVDLHTGRDATCSSAGGRPRRSRTGPSRRSRPAAGCSGVPGDRHRTASLEAAPGCGGAARRGGCAASDSRPRRRP